MNVNLAKILKMARLCRLGRKGRQAWYSRLRLVKKDHVTIRGLGSRSGCRTSLRLNRLNVEQMATEQRRLSCEYCNYSCHVNESDHFFKHLIKFHSNEPNFLVYCSNCGRSFSKVNSLQRHYNREHVHKEVADRAPVDEVDPGIDYVQEESAEEDFDEVTARSDLQRHAAKFLLRTKEDGKITQTALDMVKDSTKALLGEYLDVVKKSLMAKLKDSIGHDFEFSQDMDDLFVADDVFSGLDSEREQRSFFLENFNLVVSL